MPEIWRIAPGQLLAARGWDDQFVLYNNLSGDTHLLDGDSYALLQHVQHSPASLDALVAAFSDDVHPEDAAALPDVIADLLANLHKLFLIEPRADLPAAPC